MAADINTQSLDGRVEIFAGNEGNPAVGERNFLGVERKGLGLFACFYAWLPHKNQEASSSSVGLPKLIETAPAQRRNAVVAEREHGGDLLNGAEPYRSPIAKAPSFDHIENTESAESAAPNQTESAADRLQRMDKISKRKKFARNPPPSRIAALRNVWNTFLLRLKSFFGLNSAKGNAVADDKVFNTKLNVTPEILYATFAGQINILQRCIDLMPEIAQNVPTEWREYVFKSVRSFPTAVRYMTDELGKFIPGNQKVYLDDPVLEAFARNVGNKANFHHLKEWAPHEIANTLMEYFKVYLEKVNLVISDHLPGKAPLSLSFENCPEKFEAPGVEPRATESPHEELSTDQSVEKSESAPKNNFSFSAEDKVAIGDVLIEDLQESLRAFEEIYFELEYDQTIKALQELACSFEKTLPEEGSSLKGASSVVDGDSGVGSDESESSSAVFHAQSDTEIHSVKEDASKISYRAAEAAGFADFPYMDEDNNDSASGIHELVNRRETHKPTSV